MWGVPRKNVYHHPCPCVVLLQSATRLINIKAERAANRWLVKTGRQLVAGRLRAEGG